MNQHNISRLLQVAILVGGLSLAWHCLAERQTETRRQLGEATMAKITGQSGQAVVQSLQDISPALADWIIDFAYGEVFSRSELDLCRRELGTVAALTALGNAQPQLKVHIEGALQVGCRPEEIIEMILQMAVYAGFPSALNGIAAARDVFEQKGVQLSKPKP
jgi:4-carboxymuconolactone decarboxylase